MAGWWIIRLLAHSVTGGADQRSAARSAPLRPRGAIVAKAYYSETDKTSFAAGQLRTLQN